MKAIRIHTFGPTEEVLQYEDVPIPEPKQNEILISVYVVARIGSIPKNCPLFREENLPDRLLKSARKSPVFQPGSASWRTPARVGMQNTP
jgi:hypothetical protein